MCHSSRVNKNWNDDIWVCLAPIAVTLDINQMGDWFK